MSKIGNYNLELQKWANDLGFSTVQEALDNGYEVLENALIKIDGQTEAHKAWLKERDGILVDLAMLSDNLPHGGEAQAAVERAIEFIKKGEV